MARLRYWLRTVLLMILIMGLPWFQVAKADLDDGLVAYYPFEGNANDASGNGNHGRVYGATWTDDRFGNTNSASKFSGTDYIASENSKLSFGRNQSFSISIWVKIPESCGDSNYCGGILSKMGYGEEEVKGYQIGYNNLGVLRFEFRTGNSFGSHFHGTTSIIDNSWHLLTITIDKNSKTIKLYTDSELENTITQDWISRTSETDNLLYLGMLRGRDYFYTGSIDDLRIYNRVLSESEIQQLYQSCQPAIDIVLNNNNRVTGDTVIIDALINGPNLDSSCEPTQVVETIWVKFPDKSVMPLIQPFTGLTISPGDKMETRIFEYTFSGAESIGLYQIGGRLLHPFSGDAISTDIEELAFSP